MMIAVQKGAVSVAVATTISEVKVPLRKPNCSELPKRSPHGTVPNLCVSNLHRDHAGSV